MVATAKDQTVGPEAGPPAHPGEGHATAAAHAHGHSGNPGALALAALRVVFGDIGTSPLYALKECVSHEHGVAATQENVLGLLSLVFWSLVMVVTIKYLTFIMKADNEGEGGIMALLALVPPHLRGQSPGSASGSGSGNGSASASGNGNGSAGVNLRVGWIAAIVVFGAALLYGDGIITPAISVLSAIEGLEVATTSLHAYVVPLTCVILVTLFAVQRWGTAGIGKVFGPIMVAWFLALAGLGLTYIVKNPAVFAALSPVHAVTFFAAHGLHGFAILGSVVLCITGGEALYADMGHFGRFPIRLAWYGLVLPSLVLNYFGQGAHLLADPSAAESPFFAMVPKGGLTYALVALSAMATVIASQALISGAYSLTHQAIQLGYLPRMRIVHTSSETEGQIYIPAVNWALMIACVVLVLAFEASSRLAAAYGIAVTGTMAITSIVYFVVVRQTWGWSLGKALPLLILFLSFDLPFFGANLLKLHEGGYVPILVAAVLFTMMMIWKRGRALLAERVMESSPTLEALIGDLDARCQARVAGTAVFLSPSLRTAPMVLMNHLRHAKSLSGTVVLLTVSTEHVPRVDEAHRAALETYAQGFHRVVVRSGFMQSTDVPALLRRATQGKVAVDLRDVTYYIGRETFLATPKGKMGKVAETIFAVMSRNAGSAASYFALPPEQVVELGMQVDL